MNGAILIILSLLASPPTAEGEALAPTTATQMLYDCDFSVKYDADLDGWPDGWTRRRSREFPAFVQMEITPLPEFAASPATMGLHVVLAGGSSSTSTPVIPISSKHSLEASVELTTRNLERSQVSLVMSLLDAQGAVLESVSSAPLVGKQNQTILKVGPFVPTMGNARSAILTLQVIAPGSQLDLDGDVWFSALKLSKLPRMTLQTNAELGLVSQLDQTTVTCQISGLNPVKSELRFELLDHFGNKVAESRHDLSSHPIGTPTWNSATLNTTTSQNAAAADATKRLAEEEVARTAQWKLPLKQHGFYRVRATMYSGDVALLTREATLATLSPLPKSAVGEFGWSIPASQATLDLNPLASVLSQAGIHHAKYPVWFGDAESNLADRVAWFAERLSLQNIELTGVLDRPPAGAAGSSLTDVASIFSGTNDWQGAVDPVMTRLSLKVRRWQLGADDDLSFVGYPGLEAKISEVKTHLERFGQEVKLGIPWRFSYEAPEFSKPACGFLALRDQPELTAAELAEFLAATGVKPPVEKSATPGKLASASFRTSGSGEERLVTNSKTEKTAVAISSAQKPIQRWVGVDPLPASDYTFEVRVTDLVSRLVSAKTHGAEAIFATKPLDAEQGLLNTDGTPGELFLPWRTVSTLLAGAQYVGQLELPGGSKNYVFARNSEAVMVIWNETPTEETLQLGSELMGVDLWGRQTPLWAVEESAEEPAGHQIKVGPIPQIVTGIEAGLAKWQISVHFESSRLESIFDREQTISLKFTNPFPRGVSGEVAVASRKSWNIDSRPQRFKMLPNDSTTQKIAVRLQPDANSGSQRIRIDFQVSDGRGQRFSVYRMLHLGFEDIQMEMSTRLLPGNVLRVDQTFTNLSETPTSFQCLLFPPGRRRETQMISNLARESRTITYFIPDGDELIGKRLLMRAEEMGGARVMNYGVVAEQ